jgi:hypothetical protein
MINRVLTFNRVLPPLRAQARGGVTLIEIIFAFLILVIAVLSASGLISYGHRGTSKDFRMVTGLHILSDHMNQVLLVPYASLSARITAQPTVFSNDGAAGQNLWGVPFGLASSTKFGVFNVDISLQHQALTFGLRPIDIPSSLAYHPTTPSTFVFASVNAAYGQFDGTNASTRPFQVIKIIMTVKWTEPNGKPRRIEAVSFRANLEGTS